MSKLAEANGLLLFYCLKLKDQMHDVRSKSSPWGYTPQSNSLGFPDPPPPPIVCPSVLSYSNLKLHKTLEVKNILKQEKIMLHRIV